MFAVIKTGSKQYKVKENDIVDVELTDTENEKTITFNEVLLVSDGAKTNVGTPTVQGAEVKGDIMGEVKGDKVVAFKMKRRQGYHRTVGHRQKYLRVKINKIKS